MTTQPTSEPRTEEEAQQLQRFLKQGADTSLEITRTFEKVTANVSVPEPTELTISGTADLNKQSQGNAVVLTLTFGDLPPVLDFAFLIFVDEPDTADADAVTRPGYVGPIAFFGSEEHAAHAPPPTFVLPVTSQVQRASDAQDLTVTLVPRGAGQSKQEPATMTVQAELALVAETKGR